MAHFVRALAVSEVPQGTAKVVELGDKHIAVFHINGDFYAVDSFCPKHFVELADCLIEEDGVLCPKFGWKFDVVDGRCSMIPGEHVQTYPVKVADDAVWVAV